MTAVSGVFAGAGMLVRRRAGLVAELRRRTTQLREQRERTAALAVAAERVRITADISGTLRERIDDIGQLAHPVGDGTVPVDASFAAIELAGRAVLDSMRQAVGTLRETPTHVAGPPAVGCDLRQLRSAVQARLALFGGTIEIEDSAGRRSSRVLLPLVTSHA
jgi:hypothetical protein